MTLLHENASGRTLAGVRAWVFGLWLLKIASDPLHRLALLPASLFPPLGPWKILPAGVWAHVHSAEFLTGFRVATVLCLAGAVFGPGRRLAALLACALLTFHQAYVRSFGYINHAELPLLYAAYALAAFPVADRLLGKGREPLPAAPLVAVTAALCFTYALTAAFRLAAGGLDAFRSDTVLVWLLHDAHYPTYYRWTLGRDLLEHPGLVPLLRWGFPVVTLVELLAPLGLVCRPWRLAFLAVMVPFHLAMLFLTNILFWENLALFPLLLDLERAIGRFALTERSESRDRRSEGPGTSPRTPPPSSTD